MLFLILLSSGYKSQAPHNAYRECRSAIYPACCLLSLPPGFIEATVARETGAGPAYEARPTQWFRTETFVGDEVENQ